MCLKHCRKTRSYSYSGRRVCNGIPAEIRVQDHRDVRGKFGRIVAIGVMEHVGRLNYREFFKTASNCLEDERIFVCHMVRMKYDPGLTLSAEPLALKYVFQCRKCRTRLRAKTLHCGRENYFNIWPKEVWR